MNRKDADMNNSLKAKLQSRAGETIAETLVALLIAALALVMLAMALTASSSMITTTRNKLDAYYDKADELAQMDSLADNPAEMSSSPTVTIRDTEAQITFVTENSGTMTVTAYQNDEFSKNVVVAYKK